jgi:hypothetical protein
MQSVCLSQVLIERLYSWNYGRTDFKQCISCNNGIRLQEFNTATGFAALCIRSPRIVVTVASWMEHNVFSVSSMFPCNTGTKVRHKKLHSSHIHSCNILVTAIHSYWAVRLHASSSISFYSILFMFYLTTFSVAQIINLLATSNDRKTGRVERKWNEVVVA